MGRATLKDVAKEAGVSYQTVSKVLNGKAFISAETETRIWDAIKLLDYRPNISARNLRTQSTNLIGFSWTPDDTLNPIIDRFLYSITHHLRQAGYYVLIFPEDVTTAEHSYRDLYYTGQVSGYVLASTNHNDHRVASLIKHNIPFVSFGRANDEWDFCWVDVDGSHGIRLAMDHLLQQGHKKIALFTWPSGSQAGGDRESGYFGKMMEQGLAVNPQWVQRMENSVESGYQAAQQLLMLDEATRPTAIVCVNDMLAIGAMNCVAASGLAVGKDIAITGFDNIPMTEFLYPPLTTVQQPIEQAGKKATKMLLAQLEKQSPAEKNLPIAARLDDSSFDLVLVGFSCGLGSADCHQQIWQ